MATHCSNEDRGCEDETNCVCSCEPCLDAVQQSVEGDAFEFAEELD